MESKIKNLEVQTDLIQDDDYLLLDREMTPFKISGEDYKLFCDGVMNSPVRYYKSEGVPCSSRGDVYTLGQGILETSGLNTGIDDSAFGVPIKIHADGMTSENGWMFHTPGATNKLTISFFDSFEEFEEGDSTALVDDLLLETLGCLIPGTEGLAYTINALEE